MPQKITKGVNSMLEAAKREIEEIEPADAVKLYGRDDVVLVHLRDPRERERRRRQNHQDGRRHDEFDEREPGRRTLQPVPHGLT